MVPVWLQPLSGYVRRQALLVCVSENRRHPPFKPGLHISLTADRSSIGHHSPLIRSIGQFLIRPSLIESRRNWMYATRTVAFLPTGYKLSQSSGSISGCGCRPSGTGKQPSLLHPDPPSPGSTFVVPSSDNIPPSLNLSDSLSFT